MTYRGGQKNGVALIYNKEDKLTHKVNYQDNKLDGQATTYSPQGTITITTVYKDNTLEGLFISYYPNGVKQCQGNYVKGKLEGNFSFYNESGDLSGVTTYKQGLLDGPSITYFPKSQGGGVCQTSRYQNGLLVDDQKMFYPTGELLQQASYDKGLLKTPPVALTKKGKPIRSANKN